MADPLAGAGPAQQRAALSLTISASEGRGAGVVSTQWLSRNSGADAGPRLGLQLAASCDCSVNAAAVRNLKGVS